MDYKKIKRNNYTLHIITTDRFKKVETSIRFTKKFDVKTNAYLKLLSRVLTFNGTKKYKTVNDLSRTLEYLYDSNLSYNSFAVSNNTVFEVQIASLNQKYVSEKNIYEKVYEVVRETLVNPLVKDNRFNEKVFDLEKESLIKSILNVKDSPSDYSQVRFDEIFLEGTVYEQNNLKNIDIFKKLDNEKLYNIYKGLFSEYKIDVFVAGNIDEDIIPYLDELLSSFKEKEDYNKNLYYDLDISKKEIIEKYNTNQSNLFMGLTIDGLTDIENDYYLVLYNTLLGAMNNSVLFMNVREKNSLCYYIGSVINRFTKTITISSGINKNNYEKAVKLIRESIESMKDSKVLKPLLTNAKKTLEISYNDFYDNMKKIINHYYINEFVYIPSIEKRREIINNATLEDIISIANKVDIKSIYLLEGNINEED